jgi:hypothetical protein
VLGMIKSCLSALVGEDAKSIVLYKAAKSVFSLVVPAGSCRSTRCDE